MLDAFFTSIPGTSELQRGASDRAPAQARSRVQLPSLRRLNDQLLDDADRLGLIP